MENNQASPRPNKYMVLFTVCVGTILSGYVSSSINIALPNIMQAFGFTMDSVVWVSLSYMLPYGSMLPIMGKLGDQFGRKKMYIFGVSLFTVATMMVGLAWSSTSIITFRVIQGIGAGLLFPNAMAIVSDAFPANERGQALGMWGALAASGSALGPTIGGYIIEYLNWRILFYSIIPISIVGLVLSIYVLEESKIPANSPKIDYLGGALIVISLGSLLLALNQGSKEGWTSLYIVSILAIAITSMITFIYVESKIKFPLVDLGLFKNTTFTVSNIVGFLSFMAMFGGMFLLPFYLRNILGYTAIKAGISLLPLVGAMVLLAPLGGKLADSVGSKIPASIGMAVITLALYSFHILDERTAYSNIAWRLVLMGVGLALTMSPLSNGVMSTLPKDKVGVGAGVFNLFKNIGGSVGVAIMGTLLTSRQEFHNQVLVNYITDSSDTAMSILTTLTGGFLHNGMSSGQAHTAALTVIQGMVAKQASVIAFQDVFLITAVLCALGIIPALFIKDRTTVKMEEKNDEISGQVEYLKA
jgi:EmrB/QacA subfamily drug resistance transporter